MMENDSRVRATACNVLLQITAAVALLGASMSANAQQTFSSGSQQVHLIELYTSEGCSSCPPADRWLGSLESTPTLWSQVVPVSFHVDYWDYLGWKDDYARAEFSQRQRRYASLRQVSQVYTPGIFLDGLEWRNWRGSDTLAKDFRHNANTDVGQLTLNFDRRGSTVDFAPAATKNPGKVHLALLGTNIESPIKAGENKGSLLQHDFVVLQLISADLKRAAQGFTATLPAMTTQLKAPKYAVAAWVTNDNDSRPLQATGGWLQAE